MKAPRGIREHGRTASPAEGSVDVVCLLYTSPGRIRDALKRKNARSPRYFFRRKGVQAVQQGDGKRARSGTLFKGCLLYTSTTLQSGSVFELTMSMGGSAGNELAYNSLMLQFGVFQIDAGAKLKLAALRLDYSTDFWGTSHILN